MTTNSTSPFRQHLRGWLAAAALALDATGQCTSLGANSPTNQDQSGIMFDVVSRST